MVSYGKLVDFGMHNGKESLHYFILVELCTNLCNFHHSIHSNEQLTFILQSKQIAFRFEEHLQSSIKCNTSNDIRLRHYCPFLLEKPLECFNSIYYWKKFQNYNENIQVS